MKIRALLLALGMATVLQPVANMDSNGLLSSGAEAFPGLYVKRCAQVKALSDQSCQELDSKAKIARRAADINGKIAAALGDNINGQPVNYKVYETKDVQRVCHGERLYSRLAD